MGAAEDPSFRTGTEVLVGPGSYFPVTCIDGELDTIENRMLYKAERGASHGFVSDSIREMFTSLVSNDFTKAIWKG